MSYHLIMHLWLLGLSCRIKERTSLKISPTDSENNTSFLSQLWHHHIQHPRRWVQLPRRTDQSHRLQSNDPWYQPLQSPSVHLADSVLGEEWRCFHYSTIHPPLLGPRLQLNTLRDSDCPFVTTEPPPTMTTPTTPTTVKTTTASTPTTTEARVVSGQTTNQIRHRRFCGCSGHHRANILSW